MEGPLFLSFTSTVFLCIWKVYFYLAIQPWPSLLCCILDSSVPASSPYPLSLPLPLSTLLVKTPAS